METNTNAIKEMISPPPSPSPLAGEGRGGGKINNASVLVHPGIGWAGAFSTRYLPPGKEISFFSFIGPDFLKTIFVNF